MDEEIYLIDLKSKFDKIRLNSYYLAYSGGKDSHFLYWFIKEYLKRTDIKIVSVNTRLEHPQILERILKNSDIVLLPKLRPFEVKEKYGSPCFSKIQDEFISRYQNNNRSKNTMKYVTRTTNSKFALNKKASELLLSNKLHKISNKCCKVIKKDTLKAFEKKTGLKPILGVRQEESITRKSQYTSCFTKDKKFVPIHDLNDELLDKIYKKYDIEIPEIYNHIQRTGCMGCPYSRNIEQELSLMNDTQRNYVYKLFEESYEVLKVKKYKQLTIFDFL